MAEPKRRIKDVFNEETALKITELSGHAAHIVDPRNARSLALLEEAYKSVYEPAFPAAEERESLDSWIDRLNQPGSGVSIVVALVGENMNTEQPVVTGLSVGYYYNKQDVGLLAYNAIAPEHRNEGLGRIMVDVRKQALLDLAKSAGGALQGVFIECNDPKKVTAAEDSFDPATRIKIFQSWGAKVMPIDYVQPSLGGGIDKCTTLQLLAYPHPETGKYPEPDGIRRFINGICTSLAARSGAVPQKDPDYIQMMEQIDALERAQKPRGPKPPAP